MISWRDKDVQLYVEFYDWKGHGEIAAFTVYETL